MLQDEPAVSRAGYWVGLLSAQSSLELIARNAELVDQFLATMHQLIDFRSMGLWWSRVPYEPREYALLTLLQRHRIGRLPPEELSPRLIPLLVTIAPTARKHQVSDVVATVPLGVVCVGISLAAHKKDVAVGAA
jgi:hypothetical protein